MQLYESNEFNYFEIYKQLYYNTKSWWHTVVDVSMATY